MFSRAFSRDWVASLRLLRITAYTHKVDYVFFAYKMIIEHPHLKIGPHLVRCLITIGGGLVKWERLY